MFLRAVLFFIRAFHVVSYPYEWSTMDGYYVYHGLRLISCTPIYFGYEGILMPFEYVPIYPAVIGLLAQAFGTSVWYERAFGLACSICIATLIFVTVSRETRNRTAAFVSAMMFFGPSELSVWFLVRSIDVLAALLSLGAVFILSRNTGSKSRLATAAILLVVAFYTKQTSIFAAAAATAFVTTRNPRNGVVFGMSFAFLCASVFLLFQALSGGWFFDNAFLTTSMNPFYFRLLMSHLLRFGLVLFGAFAIAFMYSISSFKRRMDIWSFYFLFALLSTLLAGKAGAALSYFIPLFTAVCIQTGFCLADEEFNPWAPRFRTILFALLLVQTLGFFASQIRTPSEEDRIQAQRLDNYIQAHPGPVLLERIDSFATRNNRELNVEAVQLPILIMRRKFDPQVVIDAVQNKRFSLIVSSGIYFDGIPSVRRAIADNYRQIDTLSIGLFIGKMNFRVLVPE